MSDSLYPPKTLGLLFEDYQQEYVKLARPRLCHKDAGGLQDGAGGGGEHQGDGGHREGQVPYPPPPSQKDQQDDKKAKMYEKKPPTNKLFKKLKKLKLAKT